MRDHRILKFPRVLTAGLLATSLTLTLNTDSFSEAASPGTLEPSPVTQVDTDWRDSGALILREIHSASRSRRLVAEYSPPTNETSVNTADWACIRKYESGNRYHIHSGAYGFLDGAWRQYGDPRYPYAGAAPKAVQDAAALRLRRANGNKFSGSWNDPCTFNGIVQ